jgi:phosphoglycolate phosphatase-like HAD superfamily hydrolase
MHFFKPEAQAVLWMDEGVLVDSGQMDARKPRTFDRMPDVLSFLKSEGLRMAVVTEGDIARTAGALDRADLSHYFEQTDGHAAIFSAQGQEDTLHSRALTNAFLQARCTLNTNPALTIAVVGHYHNVPHARHAGLPVLGFAAGSHIGFDNAAQTREEMLYKNAFYAASAAIDLPGAVMHFRPRYKAEWHPVAAPGGS